ncbi:Protein of unknown function [Alteromonadaceae bacterium Bs31]|nr:Protein of unknown function [Alteromonadaceae bacterium Bs31]
MRDHEGTNNLGDLELEDDSDDPRRKASLEKRPPYGLIGLALLIIILAGAGAAYYFSQQHKPPLIVAAPSPIPTPLPTPRPQPSIAPAPPVETAPEITPEPLPELDNSDQYLSQQLIEENALPTLADLLAPEEIIRKFVRAVYNISKGNVVNQYRPVAGPDSAFKAQAIGRMVEIPNPKDPAVTINTAVFKNPLKNQGRYDSHIELLSKLDIGAMSALYQRFYPLMQQAHQELGEGPEQFHTAMLSAIDMLLATPQLEGEPELVLVSVQYQFLDPKLEALPNAQKMMLRLGQSNGEKMRAFFTELRAQLASTNP